jgi:hypothetical protein
VDTRTKIVPFAEAQRILAGGATVISGYFDPLLASYAERLRDLKQRDLKQRDLKQRGLKTENSPLLVLIADPGNAALPARARAELVAGLEVVDYVAEAADGLTPDIRLEQEHEQRRDELIEHIHARQRAAS